MKTIYLVRHGESDENIGGEIVGGLSPLSPKGHEQAESIAARAQRLPLQLVVASSYVRAQQTAARIIANTNVPLETEDLFRERHMPSEHTGVGKSIKDPDMVVLEEQLVANLIEHDYRHSDEENFNDLKMRGQQALAWLEARDEEHILVVTHGAFLKILIGLALFGEEFSGKEAVRLMRKMRTMNTGITVLLFDSEHKWGPWRMLTYNDHAHLG